MHKLNVTQCVLQILNAAALMADTNFKNHVTTNFAPRSMRWIRLQLEQHPYFSNLEGRLVRSWVRLLYRAATDDNSNVWDLLPSYTSLVQPPANIMHDVDYLVATMQSLMGPMPVTDLSLRTKAGSYLSWLHLVLEEFQAAQDTPHAPKVFTMLPQTSNQTNFIKISSTSLHK